VPPKVVFQPVVQIKHRIDFDVESDELSNDPIYYHVKKNVLGIQVAQLNKKSNFMLSKSQSKSMKFSINVQKQILEKGAVFEIIKLDTGQIKIKQVQSQIRKAQ
jgi:hypothetical protein